MSTNNFKFENILAVTPDFKFDNRCGDEECEHFEEELNGGEATCEHVETYYEYDTEGYKMWVAEVQEQLEKIGFSSCDRYDNERNYTGQIIADFNVFDTHGDIYKTIEVVIRNGYYTGSNMDYNIIDGDYQKELKKLDKKIESKCNRLEKVIRKNCTELLKVGQFSNGEAVYKLKNNIRR